MLGGEDTGEGEAFGAIAVFDDGANVGVALQDGADVAGRHPDDFRGLFVSKLTRLTALV